MRLAAYVERDGAFTSGAPWGCVKQWPTGRLAHGYRPDGSDWGSPLDQRWRSDGPGWHLRGNGGMLSTVSDLYKWLVALQQDRVLSPAGRRALFTPHVSESVSGEAGRGSAFVVGFPT